MNNILTLLYLFYFRFSINIEFQNTNTSIGCWQFFCYFFNYTAKTIFYTVYVTFFLKQFNPVHKISNNVAFLTSVDTNERSEPPFKHGVQSVA